MAPPPTTNHHQKQPSNNTPPRTGLDATLQRAAVRLTPGQPRRFKLVKGPARLDRSRDPVDPQAPPETFPAVLKFPVSTVPPNFAQPPWQSDGRLYQQDVPKPVADDSSDEEEAAAQKKRRWRYSQAPPRRQWILQEQVDFLETMVRRREQSRKKQKGSATTDGSSNKQPQLSSRYEGLPEHNPSQYVLFQLSSNNNNDQEPVVTVRHVTSHTIAFSQPAARHSLTLSQAEQALQDQRAGRKVVAAGNPAAHLLRPPASRNTNNTKSRLLQKLQQKSNDDDGEEADDVMGDLAGRGGGAARRELLSTLGDGLTVSDDGVLGGSDDRAFGGRGQRFGQFQQQSQQQTTQAVGSNTEERGADGAAMADDFYTRDVQAEYEELDYDAAEQFDDDDVDLGEADMAAHTTGFGGDGDEGDEEEDGEDADDDEEDNVTGAAGLASRAVFQQMLKKARGEVVPEPSEVAAQQQPRSTSPSSMNDTAKKDAETDHMSKILEAAEKSAEKAKTSKPAAAAAAPKPDAEVQVDENGQRIISLEAVRREIWLNHGFITTKRIFKIFDVSKKKHGKQRQAQLMAVIKELCNMVNDPVEGKRLVLKQHYAHMG